MQKTLLSGARSIKALAVTLAEASREEHLPDAIVRPIIMPLFQLAEKANEIYETLNSRQQNVTPTDKKKDK